MNRVILIGRLGRDPEAKTTTTGKLVVNVTMATGKDDTTEWTRLVAWEKTAELMRDHLHKGDKVAVEGRLQTRKWVDKEGRDQYSTEVIVNRVEFCGGPSAPKPSAPKQTGQARPLPEPGTPF